MSILIGHLIGDYLLQSDWMAGNKKKKGLKGLLACITHCIIWTISVYMFGFFETKSILVAILLFISHFALDRTSFVKWYCNATRIMPNPCVWKLIVVDNTMHLIMVYAIQIMFK